MYCTQFTLNVMNSWIESVHFTVNQVVTHLKMTGSTSLVKALLRQILVFLLDPFFRILAILPIIEPRPATSVVDGLREARSKAITILLLLLLLPRGHFIVTHKEIPHKRYGSNVFIIEPHESVKKCTALSVHDLRHEHLVLRVGAIVEDHGGPILAWVRGLRDAVHLRGRLGCEIVVDTHDSEGVVEELHELADVSRVEEIAIHEHGPSFEVSEERREESREGELGALGRAARARVDSRAPQIRLDYGCYFYGECGVLEEGMPANLVGYVFSGVIPNIDLELVDGGPTSGDDWGRLNSHFALIWSNRAFGGVQSPSRSRNRGSRINE